MSDSISAELTIQNIKGLHARAAAAFVKSIEDLNAEVTVERIGQEANGFSIMGLMMLAAAKGTTIKVTCSGPQAQKAMDTLTTLINNKFGEE
jgi:phosphocarrier protein